MKHRPSGRMCASCDKRFNNCSNLDFSQMRIIRKDKDGSLVVKCSEYVKTSKYELVQQ